MHIDDPDPKYRTIGGSKSDMSVGDKSSYDLSRFANLNNIFIISCYLN